MISRYCIAACMLLTTGFASSTETAGTDAPLGRLFFSQKDRMRLDQIRAGKKVDAEEGTPSPDEVPPPPPSPLSAKEISVDGFVKRSSGKSTVWINRMPQHESESKRGILLQAKGSVPSAVRLQLSSGKEVSLKAGQSYDSESNTINDVSRTAPPKADAPPAKP